MASTGKKSLAKSRPGGYLIAVIGDADTVAGFLMAGVGERDGKKDVNYFEVDLKDTPVPAIEDAFKRFTEREDIAIVLINQYIANEIRPVLAKFSAPVPAVLEIPSKEHPYDAAKDSILQRVRNMLGTS